MTSHDSFFQQKQPAAVLKHALLREYTKVFASVVGSQDRTRPVWVIDGYAGAGAYEEPDPEGAHPDGSPLIVLKMAEEFKSRQVIKSIFIESDTSAVEALDKNVTPFRDRGLSATILNGTVEEQMPSAWSAVGTNPVVTFLDPFGVAMRRETMTGLLLSRTRDLPPSEVLLNINLEAVWRIGGNLELSAGQVVPCKGQERGVERVDRFFGGTAWRQTFHDMRHEHGSAARAAEHVIEVYRDQIRHETGYDSMSIPVRRRPHHEPLFLLTLFFRHPVGGYKFADAACRATRKWRETYRRQELEEFLGRQQQESLFGDDFELENAAKDGARQEKQLDAEWVQDICDNIRGHASQRLDVARNVGQILGQTLGLAGERHIRRAWDQLADEDYLRPREKSKPMHFSTMVRV